VDGSIPQFDGPRKLLAVIGEGPNRRAVFSAIVDRAIRQYQKAAPDLLTYVVGVVDFDSNSELERVGSGGSEQLFCMGHEGSGAFNLFQTPVGVRVPKPGWLRSEAIFGPLYCLLIEEDHFWERPIIAHAVEETYRRFSDPSLPDSLARVYQRGVDARIDSALNGVAPETWWDVCELLYARGAHLDDLTERAHAIALPRLEDFAVQLREIRIDYVWKRGLPNSVTRDKAENSRALLVKRTERLIAECPFINRASNVNLAAASAVRCFVNERANEGVRKAQYILGLAICAHHWSARRDEYPDSPTKAATILGRFETIFSPGQFSMVPRYLSLRLAPFYPNVRQAHALFIEAEDVLTTPFLDSLEARTLLMTGEYRENTGERSLAIVKRLNLSHEAFEMLNRPPVRDRNTIFVTGLLPDGTTSPISIEV
jgi:hypothetical protein